MTDQKPAPPAETIPAETTATKPAPLDYRPLIETEVASGELTQDQADAFLRALYTIMERFVLDGYDFAPVDKLLSGFEKAALSASPVVDCKFSKSETKTEGR